jgi:hypothetical protein
MSVEKNAEKNRKIYNCEPCSFTTSNKSEYGRHILRRKHLYLTNPEESAIKKPNYLCTLCNFETNKTHDYARHCITRKHIENEKNVEKNEKNAEENEIDSNKEETSPIENTLHPILDSSETELDTKSITSLLIELIKENKEMRASMVELAKNQAPNHNTTTNSNNNTNQFNLQFFLNETCKDAMNIDEFIKSLQVTIEDFETTGKIGFVEGITRISREPTVPWKYSLAALGGKTEEEDEKYMNKIMKNIVKEIVIDKK